MVGQHVFCRLRDDAVIAKTIDRRREVAAIVLDRGRQSGLLGFGLADTHLQMTSAGSEGGELGRRVQSSLTRRYRFEHGFSRAAVTPIETSWHLYNALTYYLRQVIHHQIRASDPYLEGSSLPDLLGLRVVGRYLQERVASYLPRLKRSDLLELFGLSHLDPADGPLERVVAAAAATICHPGAELVGCSRRVISARRAVIEVIGQRLTTS